MNETVADVTSKEITNRIKEILVKWNYTSEALFLEHARNGILKDAEDDAARLEQLIEKRDESVNKPISCVKCWKKISLEEFQKHSKMCIACYWKMRKGLGYGAIIPSFIFLFIGLSVFYFAFMSIPSSNMAIQEHEFQSVLNGFLNFTSFQTLFTIGCMNLVGEAIEEKLGLRKTKLLYLLLVLPLIIIGLVIFGYLLYILMLW